MNSTEEADAVLSAFALYEGLVRHAIIGHDSGLSKTQEMTLVMLYKVGPMGVGSIADWLAVSREQASRAIGELEKKGLVEKSRDIENWRVIAISLSNEGKSLAESINALATKNIAKSLEAIEDKDREKLIQLSMEASALLGSAATKLAAANNPSAS